MPIYEYKCSECDQRLEILQKISDDPAKTCPGCGNDSLRKLVSAAAFKLKGSGWYETDFKNKKTGKDETSNAEPKPDAAQQPDTNTKADSAKADSSDSPTENKTDTTSTPPAKPSGAK